MALENIRLRNFRTYSDETFEVDKGVNIIVGPNTSGKTNLLEAIELITRGKSHRGPEREAIKFNKHWARLDAVADSHARTIKVELLTNDKTKNTFIIDNQSSHKLADANILPVVLFEPNHLQLLIGRPSLRRDYLDDLIEQLKSDYAKVRQNYQRTLSQRNNLLKKPPSAVNKQIFAWDVRLSELGGRIIKERTSLIDSFNKELPKLYRQLSKAKAAVELNYQTSYPPDSVETRFLKDLGSNLALDRLRGFTGQGPHRDDLEVLINNHPAGEVASRGEIRTIMLGLKILEVKLVEKVRGQKPLLLLDDVFSELDGARRQALTKFLKNYQTFITTTDADVVLQHFIDSCHIIPLVR